MLLQLAVVVMRFCSIFVNHRHCVWIRPCVHSNNSFPSPAPCLRCFGSTSVNYRTLQPCFPFNASGVKFIFVFVALFFRSYDRFRFVSVTYSAHIRFGARFWCFMFFLHCHIVHFLCVGRYGRVCVCVSVHVLVGKGGALFFILPVFNSVHSRTHHAYGRTRSFPKWMRNFSTPNASVTKGIDPHDHS